MAFQLASAYVELSSRGLSGVQSGISGIGRSLTSMTGMALAAGTALMGIGGAVGITGLLKLAAESETVKVQLQTLTGSAENAAKMVKDLKAFGASTPFEFPGLAETAKVLLAFQVSQEQIIPTMRVLGDIASATGKPLNELAQIYGKIKSQGKLTAETLDQLQERSIPVVATLAKQFGVAETEIRGMVSTGRIGFGDLQQALSTMTSEGGMFFEGMAAQSKTLGGLWSTFTDELTGLMTEIGEAIVEELDLKTILSQTTEWISMIRGDLVPTIASTIGGIRDWTTENWALIESVSTLGLGFQTLWGIVSNLDIMWGLAQQHAALFVGNTTERILVFGQNVVEVFTWIGENWYQIFETAANANLAIFQNLWTNFKNGWKALMDFFSGNAITFEWTPLLDGFKNTISKFPELTKANIQETNAEIERLNDLLQGRMQPKTNADKAASEGAAAFKTDGAKGGAGGADKAKEGAKNGVEFIGFAQFAEKMQGEANNQAKENEKMRLQQQQANGIDNLNKQANGQGLKVQVVNQWKPGAADPAFGA